jgi:hypothetical protein
MKRISGGSEIKRENYEKPGGGRERRQRVNVIIVIIFSNTKN